MIERHIVAGLMCGSSLDGVDVAVVQFDINTTKSEQVIEDWKLLEYHEYDLPTELVDDLKRMRTLTSSELFQVDSSLSEFFAQCLAQTKTEFSLAGIHGVTLYHLPEDNISIQSGNGAVCSTLLKKTVVSDFRKQDLAAGGEGTPMAILADLHLFSGYDYYLNIGGIANLSNGKDKAFDICPANQILNYFAEKLGKEYDRDGELARKGQVDSELLKTLNSWDYYRIPNPKSLDNEQIRTDFLSLIPEDISPVNALRTVSENIAIQISECISTSTKETQMFCSGGGSLNKFLMERIKALIAEKNSTIVLPEVQTIHSKEAILIALAALFRLKGLSNFISKATGASHDVCGGALYGAYDN